MLKQIENITSPISLGTSRYYKSAAYKFTDSKISTLKIYKRTSTPITESDRYTVLSGKYEYRPDLLSQEYYGIPDLWWLILEANSISDITDFVAGINLRLPGTVTSMMRGN